MIIMYTKMIDYHIKFGIVTNSDQNHKMSTELLKLIF